MYSTQCNVHGQMRDRGEMETTTVHVAPVCILMMYDVLLVRERVYLANFFRPQFLQGGVRRCKESADIEWCISISRHVYHHCNDVESLTISVITHQLHQLSGVSIAVNEHVRELYRDGSIEAPNSTVRLRVCTCRDESADMVMKLEGCEGLERGSVCRKNS